MGSFEGVEQVDSHGRRSCHCDGRKRHSTVVRAASGEAVVRLAPKARGRWMQAERLLISATRLAGSMLRLFKSSRILDTYRNALGNFQRFGMRLLGWTVCATNTH
jgi:hypothetical protein